MIDGVRVGIAHHAEQRRVPNESQADSVMRARLGPPWSKDHRMALAATIVLS